MEKKCLNCGYYNPFYSKEGANLKEEGVGRCLNEKSLRSERIQGDFEKCQHFSKKKVQAPKKTKMKQPAYKLGDKLYCPISHDDCFTSYPVVAKMPEGFLVSEAIEKNAKWGTREGIQDALLLIDAYREDMAYLLPGKLLSKLSENCLFMPTTYGVVHVLASSFTIEEVLLSAASDEPTYRLAAEGIPLDCLFSKTTLDRRFTRKA